MHKYEINGLIGQGGFGRVYSAVHLKSGKKVALKVVSSLPNKLAKAFSTQNSFNALKFEAQVLKGLNGLRKNLIVIVIDGFPKVYQTHFSRPDELNFIAESLLGKCAETEFKSAGFNNIRKAFGLGLSLVRKVIHHIILRSTGFNKCTRLVMFTEI